MLQIINLHATVADKPILKGLSLAFALSFAAPVVAQQTSVSAPPPVEAAEANLPLFDSSFKLYTTCMREGMDIQLSRDFEARGVTEANVTKADFYAAIGTTADARKAFAEKVITICAPTKTRVIESVDATTVKERQGKFLVKDPVRHILIETLTTELNKIEGELIANVQAMVFPGDGAAPNPKFDSGKIDAPNK